MLPLRNDRSRQLLRHQLSWQQWRGFISVALRVFLVLPLLLLALLWYGLAWLLEALDDRRTRDCRGGISLSTKLPRHQLSLQHGRHRTPEPRRELPAAAHRPPAEMKDR
jgi:hypothetical protein